MGTLLLLHGFTGAPTSFDAVLHTLPTEARLLVPLISGHGVPPAALDVNQFDAEVDRLADTLAHSEPAVVAGYSLGARLALGLVVRHPERVRALVLVSANAGLRTHSERALRRERDESLARMLENEGLEAFVDRWEREPLFESQLALPDSKRREERKRRLGHTEEGLAHALRTTGLGQMPDYWAALPRIQQPVEVLAGAKDERFCALARAIVSELPAGHFTAVAGAGHNLLLERPDSVAQAIVRELPS